jgi:prepilin-type N-terminal cleavage/methylation domain-containing protein
MNSQNLSRRSRGFSLMELMIVIAIIGILGSIAVPAFMRTLRTGRETAAMNSLRTIHNAEVSYNSTKGKYATLKALADEDFLQDKTYASGRPINQYIYSDSDVTADTYTAHADRSTAGAGYKDFNITEAGVVHYIENKNAKGTVPRGQGVPVTSETGGEPTTTGGDKAAPTAPANK